MNDWTKRIGALRERTFEDELNRTPEAPKLKPVCYVADRDGGTRRTVSSAIEELNIEAVPFSEITAMLETALRRPPDLVFVDLGVNATDADFAIRALAGARIACPVQLMSAINPVLVEKARRAGQREGLKMLPVLHKPFRNGLVRQIANDLGLRRDFLATQQFRVDDVLKKEWLELWYQPKVDLRSKRFVGAEVFVRAKHPQHGPLPPACFLDNSSESDLLRLTGFVLVTALEQWVDFAEVFPDIRIAINIPANALTKLPIAAIIKEVRPKAAAWPGIILEVMEEDLIPSLSVVCDVAKELSPIGARVAVDNCGAGYAALARASNLPFCELKIDQSHVTGCDRDPLTAGICETFIELAHEHDILAVAQGIETAAELKTLNKLECDIGQGYFFARPMSKESLVHELQRRLETARAPRPTAAGRPLSSVTRTAEWAEHEYP
jgi:EAL domain-containing protein (putative c-di-GMP-specific phosphodiesterase class I)